MSEEMDKETIIEKIEKIHDSFLQEVPLSLYQKEKKYKEWHELIGILRQLEEG